MWSVYGSVGPLCNRAETVSASPPDQTKVQSRCLVVLLGGPDVFLYWTGDDLIYFIRVALLIRIFLLLMNAVALECSSGKESGCWKGAEGRRNWEKIWARRHGSWRPSLVHHCYGPLFSKF